MCSFQINKPLNNLVPSFHVDGFNIDDVLINEFLGENDELHGKDHTMLINMSRVLINLSMLWGSEKWQ